MVRHGAWGTKRQRDIKSGVKARERFTLLRPSSASQRSRRDPHAAYFGGSFLGSRPFGAARVTRWQTVAHATA